MNNKIKSLLGGAVVTTSMFVAPMTSMADDAIVTGNAGILSDYIFRGIFQDSGVGNGGLDIEYAGFYAGTWVADVGEGVESTTFMRDTCMSLEVAYILGRDIPHINTQITLTLNTMKSICTQVVLPVM